MKIMLVSDRANFSTVDVYRGYCNAFKQEKIDFEFYPLHEYLSLYSADTCFCQIIAKALIPDNQITHVLFVSGVDVPVYVYDALHSHGIKVGVIATDDPHSSRPIYFERLKYLDYWFSNEKMTLDLHDERICYLPVAANNTMPFYEDKNDIPEKYRHDICFVGSVYPNREKFLEVVAKWAENNGKDFFFAGHTNYVREGSKLLDIKHATTIDNNETLKHMQGSTATLNLSRNIYWHPYLSKNARLMECIPFSANPRMYESSICRTLQIIQDDREEYRDYCGDNAFYFQTGGELIGILDFVFKSLTQESMDFFTNTMFEKTLQSGCYIHRVSRLLSFIRSRDNKKIIDKMDKDFQAI